MICLFFTFCSFPAVIFHKKEATLVLKDIHKLWAPNTKTKPYSKISELRFSEITDVFKKGFTHWYLLLVTKILIYGDGFSSTIPIDQKYIHNLQFEDTELMSLRPIYNTEKPMNTIIHECEAKQD